MTMKTLCKDVGFRAYLSVYVAVNLLLVIINFATDPQSLWFVWPLAGWGIGLLGHAMLVLGGGGSAAAR